MPHGVRIPEAPWEAKGNILRAPGSVASGFVHGFTEKPLGDVKGSAPARAAILAAGSASRLRFLRQVHGTKLVAPDDPAPLPEADGWVGRPPPGLLLAVMAADCLPLLLFHAPSGTLAAVHAGWRGATAGIARRAAEAMGVPPGELTAALGPAIGPCCYEVGGEVAEAAARHPGALAPRPGGKFLFDLPGFVGADLAAAGVAPERIASSRLCTRCGGERFFSHRRDGGPGRMAAFAGVLP